MVEIYFSKQKILLFSTGYQSFQDPLMISLISARSPVIRTENRHGNWFLVNNIVRDPVHASKYSLAKWWHHSNWFTLLLLCTSAPLVLCFNRFDRGLRQAKCEPVELRRIMTSHFVSEYFQTLKNEPLPFSLFIPYLFAFCLWWVSQDLVLVYCLVLSVINPSHILKLWYSPETKMKFKNC